MPGHGCVTIMVELGNPSEGSGNLAKARGVITVLPGFRIRCVEKEWRTCKTCAFGKQGGFSSQRQDKSGNVSSQAKTTMLTTTGGNQHIVKNVTRG